MPDPKVGASRVNAPAAVTGPEPAIGEPDPSQLKQSMERATTHRDSADKLDDKEMLKRRAASGDERKNDAGD